MSVFEKMASDLTELVKLVRLSERYCAAVAQRPELATSETHREEVNREHRISELSSLYGISS